MEPVRESAVREFAAQNHDNPRAGETSANSRPHTATESQSPATPISPPYWQHQRSISHASVDSTPRIRPISLEDNTEAYSDTSGALWAKEITIEDYVIVRGGSTGIGAYVVWNCRVQTLDGGPMTIRKRYSEFDHLREQLISAFPTTRTALPSLPPKSLIYKFRPKFLEKRRMGLTYFLNCVMLNPEFAGSPIVKDFIFAHPT